MSTQPAKQDPSKVITPVAILSFPWLDEPQPPPEGSRAGAKPMYSAALVFVPEVMARFPQFGTTIDKLQAAAAHVATEFFGDKLAAYSKSPSFKTGFRTDGQQWGYPVNSIHINPRNERRPGLVYSWPAEPGSTVPATVLDSEIEEAFYPGALVRASVRAFAFDRAGNRGISFALNNVQLIDGKAPRLDSRRPATEEFEADASQAPASLEDVGVEQ